MIKPSLQKLPKRVVSKPRVCRSQGEAETGVIHLLKNIFELIVELDTKEHWH